MPTGEADFGPDSGAPGAENLILQIVLLGPERREAFV